MAQRDILRHPKEPTTLPCMRRAAPDPSSSLYLTLFAAVAAGGCFEANPNLVNGTSAESGDAGSTGTEADTGSPGTTTGSTTIASTTIASTSGDPDSNSDGETTEAPPVCNDATHTCVEVPPDNWNGPVTITESSTRDTAPGCDPGYPDHELTAFDDLLAPNPECDCSCISPQDVTCSSAQLTKWSTANCSTNPTHTYSVSSCTSVSGGSGRWRANAPLPNGTSCTPSASSNIPDASFTERFTACGGPVDAGGCDGGEACVPHPSGESNGRVCIWASGDQMCPSNSEYSDRFAYYGDFSDTRDCTACTCGSPQGQCTGQLRLANTPCGGTITQQVWLDTDSCTNVSFTPGSASSWTQNGFTATCSDSGGDPTGSAEPTAPVTVCCR